MNPASSGVHEAVGPLHASNSVSNSVSPPPTLAAMASSSSASAPSSSFSRPHRATTSPPSPPPPPPPAASIAKAASVATIAFPTAPAPPSTLAPPPAPSASARPLRSAPGSASSSARQSRSSSPAPAPPLRTISQGHRSSIADPPSATANVNATGSAISTLTSQERRQITDSLRAHTRSSSLATLKSFASVSNPSLPINRASQPPPHPSIPAPSASTSADMPAPTHPPYKRAQSHRVARTHSAAPPYTRPSEPPSPHGAPTQPRQHPDPTHPASLDEAERERQRLKAAAAAKLAEQEAWEKTRGAGSAVLDLLKLPDLSDDDADAQHSSGSNDTSNRSSRANTPASATGSGTSGLSTPPSGGSSSSSSSSNNNNGNGNGNGLEASSSSSTTRPRRSKERRTPPRLSRSWAAARVLPSLDEVQSRRHDPVIVTSADKLLTRGISEYTLLPKILGRGKFSSVFLASKPHGPTGDPQLFAIKHTPLFPHHPLIATRLLREPTLLAELPPHPNLVNVYETIRTPGHFYLVEEYLDGYVTLEALLPMRSEQSPPHHPILPTGVANCILDQLLSAVHAIHHPLQICHRDIKPENILVHPDTLQLKLLDFGLATHFSRSDAKLSTCCGSPAFHCPEIVTALRNPVGTVHYWGPEVDAWTCGITMLRLLTGVRYPIGASHTSVRSMAIRAQRAVATIHDPELRDRVAKLLEINGERRTRYFDELVKALDSSTDEPHRGVKDFKSTTYIPVEPQHKMNLPLVVGPAAEAALTSPLLPSGATPTASKRTTPMNSRPTSPTFANVDVSDANLSPAPSLLLSNPSYQPPQRVLSYIKYCLRCAGILYHCWPDMSSSASFPPTPGPFDAAFQDFNNANAPAAGAGAGAGASASGSSASRTGDNPVSAQSEGCVVPATLSPSTPFPIQAARSERDPYSHIHIFECVLELVDPPADQADEEPQSLVQSIFSALSFGRRPANRRSLSTPPKPESLRAAAMPRPPGTPADAPVSGSSSTSGKAGDVKCLTFYLVLRFPRRPSGHVSFVGSRPSYSRSSSVAGRSQRTRSRASSAVGAERDARELHRDASTDSLARLGRLHNAHNEFAAAIHPSRKAMIDSNHTTPRASRTASPAHAHGNLKKRDGSLASHRDGDRHRRDPHELERSNLGLTIETSPELLRLAAKQGSAQNSPSPQSAPNSRATSCARSRKSSRARGLSASHRSHASNKVFVHVTDARALDAVRKALSIGGTTTDYNPDIEPDYDDAGALWASPDLRAREAVLGEDSDTGFSAGALDLKLRRPGSSRRRHASYRLASGLAGAATEDADVGETPTTAFRPTWSEIPAGAGKQRSTISHGSDDHEQYSRGRSLGPAGSVSAPAAGIPFPENPPRLRASSNLAFDVVQEESSPSTTAQSASQSRTMVDLREKVGAIATASAPSEPLATDHADDFDLSVTLASLAALTGAFSREDQPSSWDEITKLVSAVTSYLLRLQGDDLGRFTQELDTLSFDLFKALTPIAGVVDRPSGSTVQTAAMAQRLLDLLGENASSREVYLAVDTRCGEMLETQPLYVELVASGEMAWSSAAETIYLMRLLNTVLPRIRTKKPQGFSPVFGRLPQCLMLGLDAMSGVAEAACQRLADEAIKTCCSTALIVADWELHCMGTCEREPVRKTSREVLGRFLQGVTVCLPHLDGAKRALAEELFFSQNPRYALARRAEASSVKRNESLFAEISKTLSSLEVDLGSIWSNALASMARAPEDDDTRETLSALGVAGFVLHVHLLYSGYARDRPSEWKGVRAQTQLEAALPVALLALGDQTRAAASPELDEGEEDALADTSLVWMQWCMHGLERNASASRYILSADLASCLAQTLATQSVISPSPSARLIRFKLLTSLLVDRCEKAVSVRVLGQLISESPFAQLRAGAISILRTALAAWTAPMQAGHDSDEVPVQSIVALLGQIAVVPARLQLTEGGDSAEHKQAQLEAVAEESTGLIETLSLLYTLETQKKAGLASPALDGIVSGIDGYKASFVEPLAAVVEGLSSEPNASGDSAAQQRMQLQLVQSALHRLQSL